MDEWMDFFESVPGGDLVSMFRYYRAQMIAVWEWMPETWRTELSYQVTKATRGKINVERLMRALNNPLGETRDFLDTMPSAREIAGQIGRGLGEAAREALNTIISEAAWTFQELGNLPELGRLVYEELRYQVTGEEHSQQPRELTNDNNRDELNDSEILDQVLDMEQEYKESEESNSSVEVKKKKDKVVKESLKQDTETANNMAEDQPENNLMKGGDDARGGPGGHSSGINIAGMFNDQKEWQGLADELMSTGRYWCESSLLYTCQSILRPNSVINFFEGTWVSIQDQRFGQHVDIAQRDQFEYPDYTPYNLNRQVRKHGGVEEVINYSTYDGMIKRMCYEEKQKHYADNDIGPRLDQYNGINFRQEWYERGFFNIGWKPNCLTIPYEWSKWIEMDGLGVIPIAYNDEDMLWWVQARMVRAPARYAKYRPMGTGRVCPYIIGNFPYLNTTNLIHDGDGKMIGADEDNHEHNDDWFRVGESWTLRRLQESWEKVRLKEFIIKVGNHELQATTDATAGGITHSIAPFKISVVRSHMKVKDWGSLPGQSTIDDTKDVNKWDPILAWYCKDTIEWQLPTHREILRDFGPQYKNGDTEEPFDPTKVYTFRVKGGPLWSDTKCFIGSPYAAWESKGVGQTPFKPESDWEQRMAHDPNIINRNPMWNNRYSRTRPKTHQSGVEETTASMFAILNIDNLQEYYFGKYTLMDHQCTEAKILYAVQPLKLRAADRQVVVHADLTIPFQHSSVYSTYTKEDKPYWIDMKDDACTSVWLRCYGIPVENLEMKWTRQMRLFYVYEFTQRVNDRCNNPDRHYWENTNKQNQFDIEETVTNLYTSIPPATNDNAKNKVTEDKFKSIIPTKDTEKDTSKKEKSPAESKPTSRYLYKRFVLVFVHNLSMHC